jgi:hypothetical protein
MSWRGEGRDNVLADFGWNRHQLSNVSLLCSFAIGVSSPISMPVRWTFLYMMQFASNSD